MSFGRLSCRKADGQLHIVKSKAYSYHRVKYLPWRNQIKSLPGGEKNLYIPVVLIFPLDGLEDGFQFSDFSGKHHGVVEKAFAL